MYENPFYRALVSEHAGFAQRHGAVLRYPADVLPFFGVEDPTPEAMIALRDSLQPGELIYTAHTAPAFPEVPGLEQSVIPGVQMRFAGTLAPETEPSGFAIEPLSAAHAAEMVHLTDVAFPGFFRIRTIALGSYFGVRSHTGELVAMAGERVALPGVREISAVCTHPEHRGRGYGVALIQRLLLHHAAQGLTSILHAVAPNPAIALYERLGFAHSGAMQFPRFRRK